MPTIATQPHSTLHGALLAAANCERPGFTFLTPALAERTWSWQNFARAAASRALQFHGQGIRKGERLALLVIDEQDFVISFAAAILIGAVPVPMYPPVSFTRAEAYLERAIGIVERSAAVWLLGPRSLHAVLCALRERSSSVHGLLIAEELPIETDAPVAVELPPVRIEPEDLCFLQFTSGSTGDPKGVMVTHANLVANITALHRHLGSDGAVDVGLNWAPLYHDMGLVGAVVTPLLSLGRQFFLPTTTFAMRPNTWLETASRYRCSMLSTNNFGLRAAVKRPPRDSALDLSCIRVISIGAEPIIPGAIDDFVRRFEPHGLDPRALNPAYGMAETTLAVTATDPARRCRVLDVDTAALREGRLQACDSAGEIQTAELPRTALVSCGPVVPDHEIAIADEHGRELTRDRIGEVKVRGPSITAGYFANPSASTALIRDGWLHTGDLGFVHDGELFIAGRIKDVVMIGGRNYHPELIERAANGVAGVRAGHVVAFSVAGEDTERLIVIAECENPGRSQGLAHAVRTAILADTGLDSSEVVISHPWTLPKTSSGKLRRSAARTAYESGVLRSVEIKAS